MGYMGIVVSNLVMDCNVPANTSYPLICTLIMFLSSRTLFFVAKTSTKPVWHKL